MHETSEPTTTMRPVGHPLLRIALFLMAWFLVAVIGSVIAIVALLWRTGETGLQRFLATLATGKVVIHDPAVIPLIAMEHLAAVPVLVAFCWLLDRRPLRTLGVAVQSGASKQLALGVAFAVAEWAMVVGALAATGHIRTARFAGDTTLLTTGAYLLGFTVQGGVEELMVRGYILQNLLTRYTPPTAVAVSAVAFSSMHALNPNLFAQPLMAALALLNLTLYGVMTALAYLRWGTLWFAIGNHAAWNFLLSHLFGMPVSGLQLPHRVCEIQLSGAAWVTGGAFGIEASALNTAALLTLIAVLRRLPVTAPSEQWWQSVRAMSQPQVD